MPVLQWPDLEVFDGNLAVASPCGLPQFSAPVIATTEPYTFTQEWMQLLKNFIPLPLNTRHPSANKVPDYSAYVLVSEGPRSDMGGGMVKWTRTYAKVPASHDEFEQYAYAYPAFYGVILAQGATTTDISGRLAFTKTVISRLRNEYFLTGPNESYATPALIPIVGATSFLASGTIPNLHTQVLTTTTVPTKADYNGWITNATNLGFASGIAPSGTNPGQLIAESSRLSRWMGNIWVRQTRYVLAL